MPDIGDIYEHCRENLYKIIPVPCDSKTGQAISYVSIHDKRVEDLIWYQSINTSVVWCRPITEFMDYVLYMGDKVRRFKKVNNQLK